MRLCFHPIWLPFIMFLIFLNSVTYAQSGDKQSPPYKISKMLVMTYNHFDNSYSKDISDSKDIDFWNDLKLSLLATIEISGDPYYSGADRYVEVTAYEGKKLIQKNKYRIGIINYKTKAYYIPAWVYGPFCESVTIKAKIIGQNQGELIKKVVRFACGE